MSDPSMVEFMDFELMRAAYKLVRDVMKVSKGEEVVITADTASDWSVVKSTARAVSLAEGKPVVFLHETPIGVGKAADPYLPIKTLTSVLKSADVWIEYNRNWLLYSTPYWESSALGKYRYICLVGMYADALIRMVGRVNQEVMYEFQRRLAKLTRDVKHMKVTNPAGMDVEFENDPNRPVLVEGEVQGPGEYMLFGQVDWAPVEESINGVIVFDGSVWPPEELGLLRSPIKLYVREGRVYRIDGGYEARMFEKWLKSFNDDNMLAVAHLSYGANPGAKLTGNILEDERVWGIVEWGLGSQSSSFKGKLGPASSHTDGISMSPTLTGDDEKIIENGEYVHPSLAGLASKLRKPM
ncbi:MAG: aminopeptidase [Fervidicoccaceae archaeon]